MKKLAVVVCLHGNEPVSLKVVKMLKETPCFVGNPMALKQKKRFIDSDLNRSFPGKKDGNYEEKLAFDLLEKLKEFEFVVDLHSTSGNSELFGIISKPTRAKIKLAKKLNLEKLVVIHPEFEKGHSLIDNLNCAISFEAGPHDKRGLAEEMASLIKSFLESKDFGKKMGIFSCFKAVEGEDKAKLFLENFKKVEKGSLIAKGKKKYFAEEDFVPIFVGEKSYKNTICLAAKETTEEKILAKV